MGKRIHGKASKHFTHICKFCGSIRTFEHKTSNQALNCAQQRRLYCSDACMFASIKTEFDKKWPNKECVFCGKSFGRRKPSGAVRTEPQWAKMTTCSRKCLLKVRHSSKTPQELNSYFWSKIKITDSKDECWTWQHSLQKPRNGNPSYGRHTCPLHKSKCAHRIAYEKTFGMLNDDEIVRHTCDNPPCCNPSHLLKGTHKQNADDRTERNRHVPVLRDQCKKSLASSAVVKEILKDYNSLPKRKGGHAFPGGIALLSEKYKIPVLPLRGLLYYEKKRALKEQKNK